MENKTQWSSNIGFIMATAGAAIGLGNLWKFPYLMGKNGGFQFLIMYIIFTAVLGLPITITEMSMGRMTGKGPIQAYASIRPSGKIIGIMGVLCAFIVLSYYSVIGGWILKYISSYVTTQVPPADFNRYIAQSFEPIAWHLVFVVAVLAICLKGASGIEKASKFLMPTLLVMLIMIVFRSVTLEGGGAGIDFMFKMGDRFSLSTVSAALGQVFYSLSLCMGITVTYGSYLNKKENIPKNALIIAGLDSTIAILAGIAIFPAVFAFGLEPGQGPGLTFGTLPLVFGELSGGWILAIVFFVLMLFAAITSAMGLLECVVSTIIDQLGWDRKKTVFIIATLVFLVGALNSLSFGALSDVLILNYSIFDFMTMVTDNILMPIGGILMCVYVGWLWKPENIVNHIEQGGVVFKLKKAWVICIRFITPILVLIVTAVGLSTVYNIISM